MSQTHIQNLVQSGNLPPWWLLLGFIALVAFGCYWLLMPSNKPRD